ncbi:MAG: hypothetical protein WCP79_13440 [Bacillota bacterium]
MIKYAEGIANINFTNNMVKLDYAVQEHTAQSPDGKPVLSLSQRVVMPLEGFLQGFQLQEQLVAKLIADGAVSRAANGVAASVEAPSAVEIGV